MSDERTQGKLAEAATLENLKEVRHAFLNLHKKLLDLEMEAYEQKHGPQTRGQLLQLVIGNEQFAWLRMFSELIVRMDEFLDGEEPLTAAGAVSLLDAARDLLKPAEDGTPFQQKYFGAMQSHVDVIFAHRELQKMLSRGSKVSLN